MNSFSTIKFKIFNQAKVLIMTQVPSTDDIAKLEKQSLEEIH